MRSYDALMGGANMEVFTLGVGFDDLRANWPVEIEEDVYKTMLALSERGWRIAAVTYSGRNVIGMGKEGTNVAAILPFSETNTYDNEASVTLLIKWAAKLEVAMSQEKK